MVALLGRGGMGEVYRANDLRLGQPVALKFLPEETAKNETALARFYNEGRIARQVSHPNVCRVYDLGDVEGQPYLSMEYVDGEDLGSLLRRIGRLPEVKALEIARKLSAAGLDPAKLEPAEPNWQELSPFDARAAWTGTWPGTARSLRVEAAAWRGRPVYFLLLGPWSRPARMQPFEPTRGENAALVS